MRARVLLGVMAMSTALALLHCATQGDEPAAATDDASTGGDGTMPETDAVAADAADAGVTDASVDATLAHCSLDHWCRTELPGKDVSLLSVWSFGPDDAIAVGTSGMFHWDGKIWSAVDSDAGVNNLTSLWASSPNDVWAVAQGQHRLLHGTRADGGVLAWSSSETDGGPTRDMVTGAGQDLFIAGIYDDGTPALEHSAIADGGARVSTQIPITVTPFQLTGVFAASKDELWISGRADPRPVVLRAKKTGNNYVFSQSFMSATDFDFPAIWGNAPNEIWTLGVVGKNYHRAPLPDGGGAWTAVPNNAQTALANVWGSGASDVYAIGYFGGIRHWDGAKWSVSRIAVNGNPIFDNLFGIHGSSANDVWAVGEGVALHRTPGGGP